MSPSAKSSSCYQFERQPVWRGLAFASFPGLHQANTSGMRQIHLCLCRLGTSTVTGHPPSTGSETSLPCQVSWAPAGLQECGASKIRVTHSRESTTMVGRVASVGTGDTGHREGACRIEERALVPCLGQVEEQQWQSNGEELGRVVGLLLWEGTEFPRAGRKVAPVMLF